MAGVYAWGLIYGLITEEEILKLYDQEYLDYVLELKKEYKDNEYS